MKKKYEIILFVFISIVQIFVVSSIIFTNNNVAKYGEEIKIKVAPIDPYDAFRGKYIELNVSNIVKKPEDISISQKTKLYVTFRKNADGFSEMNMADIVKPKNEIYIETTAEETVSNSYTTIRIKSPFKRFYIEEIYAEEAEKAYRENAKDKDVYIKVKVLNGRSVIEDVYINNERIKEFIKKK